MLNVCPSIKPRNQNVVCEREQFIRARLQTPGRFGVVERVAPRNWRIAPQPQNPRIPFLVPTVVAAHPVQPEGIRLELRQVNRRMHPEAGRVTELVKMNTLKKGVPLSVPPCCLLLSESDVCHLSGEHPVDSEVGFHEAPNDSRLSCPAFHSCAAGESSSSLAAVSKKNA